MDAVLALGAHLDIPSTSEFNTGLSGMEDRMTKHIHAGNSRQRPIYRNIPMQGTTGTFLTSTGGSVIGPLPLKCPQGRLWNLVQLILMGADDHTPIVGAGVGGAIYAGDATVPDLGSVIDLIGSTTPWMQTYSTGAIWVGPQADVYAILYGASANSPVTLIGRFLDYPDSAVQSSGVPPMGALGS